MRGLEDIIEESKRRRVEDAKRLKSMDDDLCMCCHAYGADKRSLFLDCFYSIHEVVPEAIDLHEAGAGLRHNTGYYLRICKACRGRFLTMLGQWWEDGVARRDVPKDDDGHDEWNDPERNIPVRVNGAIVMLTREEWEARQGVRAASPAEGGEEE